MNLAAIRTDAELIAGLTGQVAVACEIGLHGAASQRAFRRQTRSERKNRERLEWIFGRCAAWYRADGDDETSGPIVGSHEGVHAAVTSFVLSGITGWLLSLFAGWLVELAVTAFVNWLLSDMSANWRANQ